MVEFLFPSCTHLAAYSPTEEFDALLMELAEKYEFRLLLCRDVETFTESLKVIKRVIRGVFFLDGVSHEDQARLIAPLAEASIPYLILGRDATTCVDQFNFKALGKGNAVDAARALLDPFLAQTVPPQLDQIALFSANTIFQTFFPNLGKFFASPEVRTGFDRRIIFYMVAGDVVGMCSARVKLKELLAASPGQESKDEKKILGDLKEAVNQFLGVLSQNFTRIDVHFKIGLPTVYDLETIPEVQTLVTFPSVHLADAKGLVLLSLGYCDLENQPLFNLSKVNPDTDSGEIDFL